MTIYLHKKKIFEISTIFFNNIKDVRVERGFCEAMKYRLLPWRNSQHGTDAMKNKGVDSVYDLVSLSFRVNIYLYVYNQKYWVCNYNK